MSHQVIITFDLDENQVAENAAKEAGRQIANQILKESFQDSYLGSYGAKRSAQIFIKNEIVEFLTENKEEIMDVAIKEVVNSLARSKAVREKVQEALNGKEERTDNGS